jgi:CheY-like chemotaxis protein
MRYKQIGSAWGDWPGGNPGLEPSAEIVRSAMYMAMTLPINIVLAEDNPSDVQIVRTVLGESGLDCVLRVVRDGAAAISLIETLDADSKAAPIDVLLLDLHLPKHDGEHILRKLRSTDRYAQTPVIVMTSSDAPSDQEVADKHAVLHYFRKPSSVKEFMMLGALVRDVIGHGRNGQ